MTQKNIYIALGFLILLLVMTTGIWFFFFRSTNSISTNTGSPTSAFGNNPSNSNTSSVNTDLNVNQTINTTASAEQKIFKITDGPVVGAMLIQTLRPTTTIARYINQDDGHVFDVPLGVAGAVPRVVSNVTIPGGQRAVWLEGGNAAIMQYVDDTGVVKTVYLGFPQATTTSVIQPTRIQFLPDNITDIAASPDGRSVAYLLKTQNGSDGYIAKSDGTNSKKVFSLPLSQLLISWPSQSTLLVQTKSAAGVTGMAFAVDIKSGSISQLVSAPGLSATADPFFSEIVYEKSDGTNEATYAHNIKNGTDMSLSFNPMPEKCIWSSLSINILYCAVPLQTTTANYLDLWHAGTASYPDGISAYALNSGLSVAIATPGSSDGGIASDIFEMSLSPDEQYLSFTTKGARALWGVLLSN